MNIYEMTKKIIKENKFLSLATTNNSGELWIAPLSYSIDKDFNFYFTTDVESKHIQHIRENPYVCFSIFDSTKNVSEIDGLQIKGIVGEVEKEKLNKIVKDYYLQVFPNEEERKAWEAEPEYFLKDEWPVYRFFQIMPLEIYKRDTENIDVDRRIEIDIEKLKEVRE